MAKSTCQACHRTVLMVSIAGQQVATDPELISVVRATQRPPSDASDGPRIAMANKTDMARRLHAERCEDYQNQARRERLSAEMREYTANQKRTPRKNRGL